MSSSFARRWRKNRALLVMFIPVVIFFIVFRYMPILGNIIAFKQYNLMEGIIGSPWAGLDNFRTLFSNPQTIQIIRNTLILSILSTIIGFPFPIIVAILLNEVKGMLFKKSIQTLLYLPHFFSWVIIGGIIVTLFGSQAGILNTALQAVTGQEYRFLYETGSWLTIFFGSSVWKEAGFGAIIYLAAITSIDPNLYEAASIDGAGKFKQIWNITIPSIMPTAVIMLILSMGRVMDVGFDQIYNLQNAAVSDIASVISTYLYTVGIQSGMYSLTTAMGLFESVVAIIFVIGSNALARRFGNSLW
ncbi:MAG: binding-protein-dependent transport system inner rane component [Paenibacillaceae bacterium]|jgi:putative aldouronate transport system permease protein|nr:binding-protein-dependent transport system inner rane component [Paenibacillaceae bacterium]